MSGPYYVSRDGRECDYRVFAKRESKVTVLEHAKLTKYEADFLCTHMNHAQAEGYRSGGEDRAFAIRDALGIAP